MPLIWVSLLIAGTATITAAVPEHDAGSDALKLVAAGVDQGFQSNQSVFHQDFSKRLGYLITGQVWGERFGIDQFLGQQNVFDFIFFVAGNGPADFSLIQIKNLENLVFPEIQDAGLVLLVYGQQQLDRSGFIKVAFIGNHFFFAGQFDWVDMSSMRMASL